MPMVMVNEGHIVHSSAMKDEDFFMAWGDLGVDYPDPWTIGDTPPASDSEVITEIVTKGAAGTTDTLANTGVLKVVEVTQDTTTYTVTDDYLVATNTIDWSPAGLEPTEGTTYSVTYRYTNPDLNELVNTLAFRKATQVQYCEVDEAGDIVANETRYSVTETPTRYLYVQFKWDAEDEDENNIYQLGFYVGSTPDEALPSGQMHFTPAEITDNGFCYMLENIEPFPRSAGKREIYEFVLTF